MNYINIYYICMSPLTVLKLGYFQIKYDEMTKQLYLGLWAFNKKNKTTLFPETLKVEENKVVLYL